MSGMAVTREHAERIVDLLKHGLVSGLGKPEPGGMCVEALVCYAMGLPHSDEPPCVSPAIRRLKIGLNDRQWSSPAARAAGLRRLALAQLGSAGAVDDREFVRRVVEMTIRKAVPAGLRSAAKVNPKHAADLEAAAVRCEQEGTREACRNAERVARAYAAYAADYAAAADAAADAADADAADADADADADDAADADAADADGDVPVSESVFPIPGLLTALHVIADYFRSLRFPTFVDVVRVNQPIHCVTAEW